jgi:hypothetical protein
MIHRASLYGAVLFTVAILGCTSTSFVSSWRAPDATPLQVKGAKVVAVAMIESEASRRVAEDRMAKELTARGAVGMPMYKILPDATPESEAQARDLLEGEDIAGLVVLRPIATDEEIVVSPDLYRGPRYDGYWGGYYGYGWSAPWAWGADVAAGAPEIRTNTIVWIETLIYSLRQNKLVWAGQSRTTNPDSVDELVAEVSGKAAEQMEQMGLIR